MPHPHHTPQTHRTHRTHRTHPTVLVLAALLLAPIALAAGGCTGPSHRSSRKGALAGVDPAVALLQRQRQEALVHYQKASALASDDKPDEALAEYRKALELNDQLYAAWNNMGQLLMAQGNYADAVGAYQIASGIEPTDPRPEYNIGLAYQQVGWAQDAYSHFEKSLERDPNYMPAMRGLVRSAEMQGRGDPELLKIIKQAELRETDASWRSYFRDQQYRVQSMLDDH